MKVLRILAAALMLPAAAVSCADLPTTSPQQTQAPDGARKSFTGFWINCSASIVVGGIGSCSAYPYGGGFIYPSYWSTNPAVATVSGNGIVFGNSPGFARIYASYGGYMSSSGVQVVAPPAPSVVTSVSVTSTTVYLGGSAQLTARAYDQYGKQMSGKTAAWSIDDPGVASIGSTGVVTGQSLGSTTARATIDGVTGTGTVWVQEYEDPGNPMCGDYYC